MSDPRERRARVALCLLAEPGDPRMTRLVHRHGAEHVYRRLLAERDLEGLETDVVTRLRGVDPDEHLDRARRLGIRFVAPGDEEWPNTLDDLADVPNVAERGGVPLGLWVRGPLRLDALAHAVAVVGSRSATTYGTQVAGAIAETLALAGHPVVSGAAYGIDVAAHLGALNAGGTSVAVLACGADRVYPAAHRRLLRHLAEHGAVVSEGPLGSAPMRVRFLSRNRLIAALSVSTVVVEAALRSGALNTANWASTLNRQVCGVPGPVTSAPSEGVHQLIRRGATLVTRGEEVVELSSASGAALLEEPRGEVRPRDALSLRETQVLDAVPHTRRAPADSIAQAAGMAEAEVAATLEALRARGLVAAAPSGWCLAGAARR